MNHLLETTFAGIKLKNPIIISSSGLTDSVEKIKELERIGAGAVVLKSLFEEQILIQSGYLTENTNYPEAYDYLKTYSESHEVASYLELIQGAKSQCGIPIIASINCYKLNNWIEFSRQIEMAGADAIELNIFMLQTELNTNSNNIENIYLNIVSKVKSTVNIPVIIKLAKQFSNIPEMVNKLYANGADGVVLFNRFYQSDIDINKLQFVSGDLFSSHSEMADSIRWTAIVSGKIPQISLAASTGIKEWDDVIKCILAGASAVELCSTIYQHGDEIIAAMCRGIEEWMISKNFKSIDSFKGKLSTSKIEDPTLFERIQFMKYYSNRD